MGLTRVDWLRCDRPPAAPRAHLHATKGWELRVGARRGTSARTRAHARPGPVAARPVEIDCARGDARRRVGARRGASARVQNFGHSVLWLCFLSRAAARPARPARTA